PPTPSRLSTLFLHDALPILVWIPSPTRCAPSLASPNSSTKSASRSSGTPAGTRPFAEPRRGREVIPSAIPLRRLFQLGQIKPPADRKSTRLNSSHQINSYAV